MDPNPYESPKHFQSTKPPKKAPFGRMGLAILLSLFTLPVSIIAGFVICLAGDAMTVRYSEAPVIAGVLAGIATGSAMIYLAVRAAIGPS